VLFADQSTQLSANPGMAPAVHVINRMSSQATVTRNLGGMPWREAMPAWSIRYPSIVDHTSIAQMATAISVNAMAKPTGPLRTKVTAASTMNGNTITTVATMAMRMTPANRLRNRAVFCAVHGSNSLAERTPAWIPRTAPSRPLPDILQFEDLESSPSMFAVVDGSGANGWVGAILGLTMCSVMRSGVSSEVPVWN